MVTLVQKGESEPGIGNESIEWHSIGFSLLILGLTGLLVIFQAFVLFSTYDSIWSNNKVGHFLTWILLVGGSAAVVAVFYFHAPLHYGISDKGIHLRCLGRTKILQWEGITNMKWSQQILNYGAVTVRLHEDQKDESLMVHFDAYREMYKEYRKHCRHLDV